MKKTIIVFFLVLAILGCKGDDDTSDNNIVGIWRLIQLNLDPGDGNGTFQNVDSEKIIEFKSDGTIVSNGSICAPSEGSTNATSGTYSLSDFTISSDDCVQTEMSILFEIVGSNVILSFPCIEAYQEKYVPLE